MKKILSLVIIGVMCLTLVGCGNDNSNANNEKNSDTQNSNDNNNKSSATEVGNDEYGYMNIPNDWEARDPSYGYIEMYDYLNEDNVANSHILIRKIEEYYDVELRAKANEKEYTSTPFISDYASVGTESCIISNYTCYVFKMENNNGSDPTIMVAGTSEYYYFLSNGTKSTAIRVVMTKPITEEVQDILKTFRFNK